MFTVSPAVQSSSNCSLDPMTLGFTTSVKTPPMPIDLPRPLSSHS
jgi:hypothetical protein